MNKRSALKLMLDDRILYNDMYPEKAFIYSKDHKCFHVRCLNKETESTHIMVVSLPNFDWTTKPPEEHYKAGNVLGINRVLASGSSMYSIVTVVQVSADAVMLIGLTGNRFTDKVVKLNSDDTASEIVIKCAAEGGTNSVSITKLADSQKEYYKQLNDA